ncbi:MAG: hypothetical protein HN742_07455 [Lentisphaerae bacterium]|nr:hypothetical protein [Lentisphaerota bacterium]MBT4814139.1 hypothetical protein [Lentisphaerota bacterium]MBT5607364.1 hypothetical protein [Lentisphaerota bacterium]MBT7058374.1 hypothetical protein [Lentisphaerota bacterium]MBT7841691.1 hypothetical protein [Lentisphaerota bacterium]
MKTSRSNPATAAAPVLALDIGNVCIALQPTECANVFGYPSVEALLSKHPRMGPWTVLLETGRMSEADYIRRLAEEADISEDRVITAMDLVLGPELPGLADFLQAATETGLRPVFMSDVSTIHYRLLQERLTFLHFIHGAVLSYEVGCQKPAAGMYEAMEREYCDGRPPALYVDDKLENIEAARERGWNCYRFGNFREATERLGHCRP